MKLLFKYLMSILIVAAIAVSLWLYYPTYQIQQMKEEAAPASAQAALSYVDYFGKLDKDTLTHLAIGDSIIAGFGSENNVSFVSYFSYLLGEQTDKTVILENKGILGINSSDLNARVQTGEFDEQIKNADLITINVGGNDILQTLDDGDYQNVVRNFQSMQATFTKNLTDISNKINTMNPDATIVFLEMYNPLKQDHELYSVADQLLPKWNVKIYEIAHQFNHAIVLETTKVINAHHLQYLSDDGVHPNALGYEALSDQMMEQLQKKPFAKSTI
ncbi:GDSL-type esterase/lipase family protein [Bacillus sp. B190/17]|uniref:GDSL-type esterase/lipase family protein n=1 Tax=Bacillus lumedeiriae TaxID=3058829 RepID=A0ABW8IBY2_9BACI